MAHLARKILADALAMGRQAGRFSLAAPRATFRRTGHKPARHLKDTSACPLHPPASKGRWLFSAKQRPGDQRQIREQQTGEHEQRDQDQADLAAPRPSASHEVVERVAHMLCSTHANKKPACLWQAGFWFQRRTAVSM